MVEKVSSRPDSDNDRDHLATVVDLIVNWDRTRRCGASHGSWFSNPATKSEE
jgi:hypothetical protein